MSPNNETSLITIGITCFNARETIIRAIDSALAQDWGNTEIIIVDDASSDGSAALVAEAVKTCPRARLVIHDVNQGPAAARQSIIDHARGEFLAFFDDDDVSLPGRIRVQYSRIVQYEQESETRLVACYASGRRVYPNGYEVALRAIGSQPPIPHGTDVANRLLFFESRPGFFFGGGTPSCSLMARTRVFREIGGFDPQFRRVEDIDFAVRLALAGGHFIGCPEALFIQYATTGTDKAPEKNLEAEQKLAQKHKDYLMSVGRYVYAHDWPLLRYYHFRRDYMRFFWVLLRLFARYPLKTAAHFLQTAPRRWKHERQMERRVAS